MDLGEGWNRVEISAVWRALMRLPLLHISRNDALLTIERMDVTPDPEATGLDRRGIYASHGARIVLFNAAFTHEGTDDGVPLDLLIARLVGQSLWRRYRPVIAIDDQVRFGELYARFHLEPDRLRAEDEKAFAALQRIFAEVIPPPSRDEILAAVRAARPELAGLVIVFGPPPFLHLELGYPFSFVQAVGLDGNVLSYAYDVATRRVWHRHPQAFEAFVRATRYPMAPERLPAEAVLVAWHALTRGVPGRLLSDEGLGDGINRVRRPQTYLEDDGTIVTSGWTMGPSGPERHTIRVSRSSEVRVVSTVEV
jgi:hypothetical protein